MNTERLFRLLAAVCAPGAPFRTALQQSLTSLDLPGGHVLQETGASVARAYFLNDGLAMAYTRDAPGKKVSWLWQAGEFVVAQGGFLTGTPAEETIELCRASSLLCLDHGAFHRLLADFPEARDTCCYLLGQCHRRAREHAHDLLWLAAGERLEKLRRHIPGLEQHVAQEHIASYLGIAPQSLSRIKRRNKLRPEK